MKSKLEILSAETKKGTSKISKEAYELTICQCILRSEKVLESGEVKEDVKVGELILPKGMPVPLPGEYLGEFEMAVDMRTKQIGARLVNLTPFGKSVLKPQSKSV